MDAMGIRLVEVGSTIGVNKAKRYMTTHSKYMSNLLSLVIAIKISAHINTK